MIENFVKKLKAINTYFPIRVAKFLIYNHYDTMKNVLHEDKNNILQIGGKNVKFVYNNIEFNFDEMTDKYGTFIRLHNKSNTQECILIIIDKKTKLTHIQTLSYFPDCITDNITQGGLGTLLLKTTLSFLKTNKNKYNIKRVTLKDNSYKMCYSGNNISLSKMYVMMNGDTWYGKYGFRPYDSINNKPDELKTTFYLKNKQIMQNIKIKDVSNLYDIIKKSYNKELHKGINLNVIKKTIKENPNEKLTKFIKSFLTFYDKTCSLFEKFYNEIYIQIKLYDFHGSSFYVDL
jgi:hypothetical protein